MLIFYLRVYNILYSMGISRIGVIIRARNVVVENNI